MQVKSTSLVVLFILLLVFPPRALAQTTAGCTGPTIGATTYTPDQTALTAFWNQLTSHGTIVNWNTACGLCGQYGVSCVSNRITSLSLNSVSLGGPISTTLGQLTSLTHLDLGRGTLTGTLPTQLGLLTSLNYLDISIHSLSGTFPTQIANCPLTRLDFSRNTFTSWSYASFSSSLAGMTYLDMSFNSAPAFALWPQINIFTGLTYLGLAGVTINSVPTQIGALTNLNTLLLSNNAFGSGTLLTDIGKLTLLTQLTLGGSGFSGTLPTEIGLLTHMQYFDASYNAFGPSIPTQIGAMTTLQYADFRHNSFTSFPTQIWISTITHLDMNTNSVAGTIPTTISSLTSLSYFDFSATSITGSIPTQIGKCTALTYFALANTAMTATIPTEMGLLTALTSLSLVTIPLTGTIPTQLGTLSHIQYMAISANPSLTGTIPTELMLPTLTRLDLGYNHLTGSIPGNIADTGPTMQVFLTGGNYFLGPIPSTIATPSNFPALSYFSPTNAATTNTIWCPIPNYSWVGGDYTTVSGWCTSQCTAGYCKNGGTCAAGAAPVCVCPPGYNGTYCQNYYPCLISQCGAFGTCVAVANVSYSCTCLSGYTGTYCDSFSYPLYTIVTNSTNYVDPCATVWNLMAPPATVYYYNPLAVYGGYVLTGFNYATVGGTSQQGQAFLYNCNTLPCTLVSTFTGTTSGRSALFGFSGDFNANFMVVGAPWNNGYKGSVHLFTYTSTSVTWVTSFQGSLGATLDRFGVSVAVSENDLLVVGASSATVSSMSYAGRIYVYLCTQTGCTQRDTPLPTGQAAGDWFGSSVASYENIVVASSPQKASNNGSVYVFNCTVVPCTQLAQLAPSLQTSGGQFGYSIAIWGKWVVVGEPYATINSNANQGAVFVFNCASYPCTQMPILTAYDGAAGDQLGLSVAIFNGVVTSGANYKNTYSGAVYSWDCNVNPCQILTMTAPTDITTNQYYGTTVFSRDKLIVAGYWGKTQGGFYTMSMVNATICSPTPCLNSGTCSSVGYVYTCTCLNSYYNGTNCQNYYGQCATLSPCQNGATCISGNYSYSCACLNSYYNGTTCQNYYGQCATLTPCQNGGTCTAGNFSYSCACTTGWTGTNCTQYVTVAGCTGPTVGATTVQFDQNALSAFYTGLSSHGTLVWNVSCGLCGQTGVTCSNNRVITVSIPAKGLSGPISTQWGALTALTYMDVSTDGLSGPIPTELGQLTSLVTLYLQNNFFYSSIPTQLGLATSLQNLNFMTAHLTGTIPTELGKLTNLITLQIASDSVTGPIPTEVGNLVNITSLTLNSDSFTSTLPTEMGRLSKMTYLLLYSDSLTGTIPTEYGNMVAIETFNLYSNGLNGTIPTELGKITNMRNMELFTNHLTGQLPTQLGNMHALSYLYLNGNMLGGTIPTEFGTMTLLTSLQLQTNSISGTIPTEFGKMTILTHLELETNSLSGSIPTELGLQAKLLYLNLQANKINGTLPTELGKLTLLTYLNVETNTITGTLPTEIGLLTSLTNLLVTSDFLTGTIPTQIGNLHKLNTMLISANQLSGQLPTQLGNLTLLVQLDLSNNTITGTIPTELGYLTALTYLSLSNNLMTGTIPTQLHIATLHTLLLATGNNFCPQIDYSSWATVNDYNAYDCKECSTSYNTCVNGATCVNGINNITCVCRTHFNGTNCQNDYSKCDISPCLYQGTCAATNGSYICTCSQGLTGPNCQTDNENLSVISCTVGVQPCYISGYMLVSSCTSGSGGNCATNCLPNPCQNGGTCHSYSGSTTQHYCTCASGWYGPYCAYAHEEQRDFHVYVQGLSPIGWTTTSYLNGRMDLCGQTSDTSNFYCSGGRITQVIIYSPLSTTVSISETVPLLMSNMNMLRFISMYNIKFNYLNTELNSVLNPNNFGFFVLETCQINSTIPSQIANYFGSTQLALDNTQVYGPIPTFLNSYTNLAQLKLDNNNLYGTIPPATLTYLLTSSNVQTLTLHPNQLSCPIPNYSAIPTNDYSSWGSYCTPCSNKTCNYYELCIPVSGVATCVADCAVSYPCENGGNCTYQTANSYLPQCICPTNFNGTLCQNNYNQCTPSPCINSGTCAAGNFSFVCTCPPNFNGTICQNNYNQCTPTPCINGGQCTAGNYSYSCSCPTGFNGVNCQNDFSHCLSNPCLYGGTCTPFNYTYTCTCPAGLTGVNCQTDNEICRIVTCSGSNPCYLTGAAVVCSCVSGSGSNCASSCSINPCQNNGTCYSYLGSTTDHYCVCQSGWYGPYCTFPYPEQGDAFIYFLGLSSSGSYIYTLNGRKNLCNQMNSYTGTVSCSVGGRIIYIVAISSSVSSPTVLASEQVSLIGTNMANVQHLYFEAIQFLSFKTTLLSFVGSSSMTVLQSLYSSFNSPFMIPTEFALLSSLTSLTLADSNLLGTIPTQLASITGLATLNIESNLIYGAIPSSLISKIISNNAISSTLLAENNLLSCPVRNYSAAYTNDYNIVVHSCAACVTNTCQYYEVCVVNAMNQSLCFPDCGGSFPCENGGTCNYNQTTGAPSCACASNYNGTICQNDFTHCLSSPCLNGGTCTPTNGSFICTCQNGYNGTICQNNFTACFSSPCYYETLCTPLNNSYSCACTSGLTGQSCSVDTETCFPVPCVNNSLGCYDSDYLAVCNCTGGSNNNCATSCSTNPCLNNGTCHVYNGSSTQHYCTCTTGWYGPYCSFTKKESQDAYIYLLGLAVGGMFNGIQLNGRAPDLCSQSKGLTSVSCTSGSISSLVFDSGSSTPAVMSETMPLYCGNFNSLASVKWNGTNFSFFYQDIRGLSVGSAPIASIVMTNSMSAGSPIPTEIGYISTLTRLSLQNMLLVGSLPTQLTTYRITDIELSGNLLSGPINPLFVTPGTFNITSTLFLYPNLFSCPIINYSTDTYNDYSSYTSLCSSKCNSSVINCTDSWTVCAPALSGGVCVTDCFGSSPCKNGGTCVVSNNTTGFTSCACVAGYNGTICQNDFHQCQLSPCINGGTCTPTNGSFVCTCLPGYNGTYCQNNFHDCLLSPCINGGTCTPKNYSYICTCMDGFNGTNCQNDFHQCIINPCLYGGICSPLNNTFSCSCPAGLTGNTCQIDHDTCITVPCSVNTTWCNPFNETVTCSCNSSSPSNNCDYPVTCSSSPCQNGGTCVSYTGGRYCLCPLGFFGVYCAFPFVEQEDLHAYMTGLTLDGQYIYKYNARTSLCNQSIRNTSIICDIYGRVNQVTVKEIGAAPSSSFYETFPYYVGNAFYINSLLMSTDNLEFITEEIDSAVNVPLSILIVSEGNLPFTLPAVIGELKGLTYLSITNSYLYGTIPTELGFRRISYIDLHGNYLTGTIPSQIIYSGNGTLLLSDNALYCPARNYASVYVDDYPTQAVSCQLNCNGTICPYNQVCVDYYGRCVTDCLVNFPCENRGTCTFASNTLLPYCMCPSQLINGTQCENNYEGCLSSHCENGGSCSPTNNSFVCTCPQGGFNGTLCENDYTRCNPMINNITTLCFNGGACVAGNYSYSCVCPDGVNGTYCQNDYSRCFSAPCQNGGTCRTGNCSYTCLCASGYNNTNCQDNINECKSSPCLNGGTCNNGINSFTCTCRQGYYNNTLCQDSINECSSSPCLNGGSCINKINGFVCVCPFGFNNTLCQDDYNQCSSSPCLNSGNCTDIKNGFTCACKTGYFNNTRCQDNINLCSTGMLCYNGGTCVNGINTYSCMCPPGWEGNNCEIQHNNCNPNQCQHSSNCTNLVNDYNCTCPIGYTGKNCDQIVDFCVNNTCKNNGTCVNEPFISNYTCECPLGFTDYFCNTTVHDCELDQPCRNGGNCTSPPSSTYQNFTYSCACKLPFVGPNCQTKLNSCQLGNSCTNGATCVPVTDTTYTCSCITGFEGTYCETMTNNCLLSNCCLNGGVCKNIIAGYKCNCDGTGFTGFCCQSNINDCPGNKCQFGSTCVDGINNYTCSCVKGYEGYYCQTQIDNCLSSPCKNGGVCLNGINSFSCDCSDTGYSGSVCQEIINNCLPTSCSNGGVCMNALKSFSCNCLPSTSGSTCLKIDDKFSRVSLTAVDNPSQSVMVVQVITTISSVFTLVDPLLQGHLNIIVTVQPEANNPEYLLSSFFIAGQNRARFCASNRILVLNWYLQCSGQYPCVITNGTYLRQTILDLSISQQICSVPASMGGSTPSSGNPSSSSPSFNSLSTFSTQRSTQVVKALNPITLTVSSSTTGTIVDQISCQSIMVYVPFSHRTFFLMQNGAAVGPFASSLKYHPVEGNSVIFVVDPRNFNPLTDSADGGSTVDITLISVCSVTYSELVTTPSSRKRGILRNSQDRQTRTVSVSLMSSASVVLNDTSQATTAIAVISVMGVLVGCFFLVTVVFKARHRTQKQD